MSTLALAPIHAVRLPAPSAATLAALNRAQEMILQFPQAEIATEHALHGGMYARTIRLAPQTVMVGSLILRATVLIVQGECSMVAGDQRVDLTGYNVILGDPGRKGLFITRGPVEMTMVFPTTARTIEDAENEVFAEADQLMSRKDGSRDRVVVTDDGEGS